MDREVVREKARLAGCFLKNMRRGVDFLDLADEILVLLTSISRFRLAIRLCYLISLSKIVQIVLNALLLKYFRHDLNWLFLYQELRFWLL